MKSEEIRQAYAETAKGYDWKISLLEKISGAHALRKEMMQKAKGRVLDVACGTGRNFAHFGKDCEVTGIDISPEMLEKARAKANTVSLKIDVREMDVEHLDFASQEFDTVVSTLGLCTYPNPIVAIQEMTRVCKSSGTLLFLEHGISDRKWLNNLQHRCAHRLEKTSGCHIDRDPLSLIQKVPLHIISQRRSCFGILYAIEATPL